MAESRLPDAELEVLSCLHRRREATARELREDLRAQRPMAHGSVLTPLGRLERRGLVSRRKGPVGKAYLYAPTRQAAATVRPLLKRLLNRVFDGNAVELVASLFDTRPPTAKELDELQRLVSDLRRKRGGSHA
jgi:BlaI family transcriptional regulator, penicillinase repressor